MVERHLYMVEASWVRIPPRLLKAMKSDELQVYISEALEEHGLNPDVDIVPNENEYIAKFRHVEDCEGCDGDDEWLWRIGSEFVYYGQTDEELENVVDQKIQNIADKNKEMHSRRDFPSREFVDWLDRKDTYSISISEVRREYPGFFEAYELGPVTMSMENGRQMVPVCDFIDCVKYTYPQD